MMMMFPELNIGSMNDVAQEKHVWYVGALVLLAIYLSIENKKS